MRKGTNIIILELFSPRKMDKQGAMLTQMATIVTKINATTLVLKNIADLVKNR
jgi:hypothetical protein